MREERIARDLELLGSNDVDEELAREVASIIVRRQSASQFLPVLRMTNRKMLFAIGSHIRGRVSWNVVDYPWMTDPVEQLALELSIETGLYIRHIDRVPGDVYMMRSHFRDESGNGEDNEWIVFRDRDSAVRGAEQELEERYERGELQVPDEYITINDDAIRETAIEFAEMNVDSMSDSEVIRDADVEEAMDELVRKRDKALRNNKLSTADRIDRQIAELIAESRRELIQDHASYEEDNLRSDPLGINEYPPPDPGEYPDWVNVHYDFAANEAVRNEGAASVLSIDGNEIQLPSGGVAYLSWRAPWRAPI